MSCRSPSVRVGVVRVQVYASCRGWGFYCLPTGPALVPLEGGAGPPKGLPPKPGELLSVRHPFPLCRGWAAFPARPGAARSVADFASCH